MFHNVLAQFSFFILCHILDRRTWETLCKICVSMVWANSSWRKIWKSCLIHTECKILSQCFVSDSNSCIFQYYCIYFANANLFPTLFTILAVSIWWRFVAMFLINTESQMIRRRNYSIANNVPQWWWMLGFFNNFPTFLSSLLATS